MGRWTAGPAPVPRGLLRHRQRAHPPRPAGRLPTLPPRPAGLLFHPCPPGQRAGADDEGGV